MRNTSPWNERSRHRPVMVATEVERSPHQAWDLVRELVAKRRRGEIIHRDRRAHEVLRLLGGTAAYDAVASESEHLEPVFLDAYAVLSEIDQLMHRLGQIVGATTAPGETRYPGP